MEIVFDTHGNEKQKQCAKDWCDPAVTDIVYGGSKGSAKSYTGCSLIFGDAFIYPGTHYFIARRKLNDLRKFTIPSIYEVFEHWRVSNAYYKFNGQDNFFELHNNSKVFLLEAAPLPSDPKYARFGSIQMTRGWIEEAGEFEQEAMTSLAASIGRWKNDEYNLTGKLLQTCNPAKNYLYREYYKKFRSGELESHKRFIQALPEDNKRMPVGYLESLRRILKGAERERLLFGNWEYDDNPNSLCDYDNILALFENDQIKPEGEKYITADIARFGSDKAIICVWYGWVIIEFQIFDKSKTTEIQTCINAMRSKHNIAKHFCIADEDGIGGGVVDNCGINGFVNNAAPAEEESKDGMEKKNYQNLQSQCIYKLADKINENAIFVQAELSEAHRGEIIEDMETIESYKSDSDGKLRIIPKEKVKEKIGRSPDWRDVFMMRIWFELFKQVSRARPFGVGRKIEW